MLTLNFNPFPELTTRRFLLRRSTREDIPAIYTMRSNPEVMRYVARPLAQSIADAEVIFQMMEEKIDQNTGINWSISRRNDPSTYLGVMGIFRTQPENHRGELGYMLLPEYWNQGIVSELIPAVLEYGFHRVGFHSIEAVIAPENHASRRVLEKNGFVQEAHFRENLYFEGAFLDSVILSILQRDFITETDETGFD